MTRWTGLGLAGLIFLSVAPLTIRAAAVTEPAKGPDVICRGGPATAAWAGGDGPRLQATECNVAKRGPLRVLLVRVAFQDQHGAQPVTEADARVLAEMVEEFFDHVSHGALALEMHVSPLANVRRSAAAYGGISGLRTDAFAALRGRGIEEADYDLDVIYSVGGPGSMAWRGCRGALVSVSTNSALSDADLTSVFGTVCHELGHNLGLEHARGWRAADGLILGQGAVEDYQNPFDTMGQHYESVSSASFGKFKPFNAYAQQKLEWLPPGNVAVVSQPGILRLLPLDVRELTPGGTHALTVKLDGAREYWVESRTNWAEALLVQAIIPSYGGGEPLLLDTRPASGGWYNAHLEVGRSLLDAEGRLRITPRLPVGAAPPGALDVEIRRVHHGFHEADAGAPPDDARVVALDDATEGRAVHLAGPDEPWSVPVSVPAAGRYLVWLRVRSPAGGLPLRLTPAVGPAVEAFVPAAPNWRWLWLQAPPAAGSVNPGPLLVDLPAGESELVLAAAAEAWLDLLLLTDDDSPNTPPYLAPQPQIRLAAGTTTAAVRLSVADLGASRTNPVNVVVRSSDTNLVHFWAAGATPNAPLAATDQTNIVTSEVWPRLLLSVVPGALGSTTLKIGVVDGDGNGVSREVSVAVHGPVQSLVEDAGPGGTVRLPAGVFRDRLVLSFDVTLEGAAGTVIEAGGARPVVLVEAGARVTLRDLTLRQGTRGVVNRGDLLLERVLVTGHSAGGLDNFGTLELRDCTVAGNSGREPGGGLRNRGEAVVRGSTFNDNDTTANGGAIANEGPRLELLHSTLSGNAAGAANEQTDRQGYGGRGGGLYNSGTAAVVSCTIVQNLAGAGGGGLFNVGQNGVQLVLQGTILAGNFILNGAGPDGGGYGAGPVHSAGFNLVADPAGLDLVGDLQGNRLGVPARLGPLAHNGGPTRTHLPLPDSPAIDAGIGADATHDQRGVSRRVDVAAAPDAADGADIGAAEYTPLPPARVAAAAAMDAASRVAVLSVNVGAAVAVSGVDFTVRYPPALLRPLEVLPGPDTPGALLEADPGVSLPGRLGLRARFPADRPAARDGRRVLHAVFEVIRELRDPAQVRFEFTDEVVPRAAAGAGGGVVPALFPPFVEAAAAPPPRLTVQPQADGRVAVIFTALPGIRVELEATADFGPWEPLGTMTVTDGPAVLHDEARRPHRFYRWRR